MEPPIVQEVIRECLAANPRMQYAAAQDAEFHAAISTPRQALALVDQALAAEDLPEETRRRVAARVVAAGLDRCRVEQSRDLMARLGIATL